VMLYRQNIKTKRLTERLDDKLFGPFVLKWNVGERAAIWVRIAHQDEYSPCIYVWLLEPYWESTNPTRKQDLQLTDEVDDQPSYMAEHIVDSWYYRATTAKFLKWFMHNIVVWAGYGPEENSWVPYKVLQSTAEDALKEYHAKYLRCLRDHLV
jgi:hypothetical protein